MQPAATPVGVALAGDVATRHLPLVGNIGMLTAADTKAISDATGVKCQVRGRGANRPTRLMTVTGPLGQHEEAIRMAIACVFLVAQSSRGAATKRGVRRGNG